MEAIMPWGAVVGAGISLIAQNKSSKAAKQAAQEASQTQANAANAGVAETRRQFDSAQQVLAPYVQSGQGAMNGQAALLGIGPTGADGQQQAISGLLQSPEYTNMVQQGEEALLANASATGGLRGGNTQRALATLRPNILQQLIEQRFSRLGSLAQLGQASAAGQASAGIQSGAQVAGLLQQQGSAIAGGQVAAGQASAGMWNATGNTASQLGYLYLLNNQRNKGGQGGYQGGGLAPGYYPNNGGGE
jgi:hypothetical protein